MDGAKKKICVIGVGPSGMSVNVAFKMAKDAGEDVPDLTFFEKQDTFGGLWNYNWRTGVDSNGEPIHNTMYEGLYINAPKENYEYPYYTFMDHWGKATPSYPPRLAMRGYLETRFKKFGDPSMVQFNTVVQNVKYDDATEKFTVTTRNYKEKLEKTHVFDYVITCTGHFSYPIAPEIPGYENYTGTLIHSHDQRQFKNYKDKTVMVIGTSYSGEDVASIAYKNGATRLVCCYRSKPMPYTWPDCFSNHQLPTKIDGKTLTFPDGAVIDVDVIVMCTGFNLHYPFMEEKIRLVSPNQIVPENLYKKIFLNSNNKVMYLGMQQQAYTFTMMDVQAFFVRDVLMGKKTLPSTADQEAWNTKWLARQTAFTSVKDAIQCQGDYITELMNECAYPKKWDTQKTTNNFFKWMEDKLADVMKFRDLTFVSANTGVESLKTKTPWFENHENSVEHFLSNGVEK
jgi:trimethylamine monooxygenase